MNDLEYQHKKELALLAMDQYYNYNTSIISDETYDNLIRELREYESLNNINDPTSPTRIVSTDVKSNKNKIKHIKRMYSMMDIFSNKELKETRVPNDTCFYVEFKFDGLSLNLIYSDGKLAKAVTRGNGLVGEDVTRNALNVNGVLKEIDVTSLVEIRGEVVLPLDKLGVVNKIREKSGKELFSNARNAASGILRQKDDPDDLIKYLEFYTYGIGYTDDIVLKETENHNKLMEILRDKIGFQKYPNSSFVVKDLNGVEEIYQNVILTRKSLSIVIDGIVYRVLNRRVEESLGYNGKYPLFMWAYKFPAEEKTTKLLDVEFNVGKTGKVTPVAILEPVSIDGVTIKRVTLHNTAILNGLDMKIGDIVGVIRSGDVIPVITQVYIDKRESTRDINIPTECPVCGHTLVNEKYLVCKNSNCKSKLISRLEHFISRNAFNIVSLGEKMLLELINNGSINNLVDILKLDENSFVNVPNCKEAKIRNILDGINDSKSIRLPNLIYSLSIPGIGYTMAEAMAKELGEEWYRCSSKEFENIGGIGKLVASGIEDYIAENLDTITELLKICTIKY